MRCLVADPRRAALPPPTPDSLDFRWTVSGNAALDRPVIGPAIALAADHQAASEINDGN